MDQTPPPSHEQHISPAGGVVDHGKDRFASLGVPARLGLFLLALLAGLSFSQFFLIAVLSVDNALVRTVASMAGLWLGFLLVIWWTSRRWGSGDPLTDFGLRAFRRRDVPLGMALGLLGQIAVIPALYVPIRLIAPEQVDKVSDVAVDLVALAPGIEFIGLFVVAGMLAPLIEELLFRGYAYRLLAPRLGVAATIAVTSLVFGLFHFQGIQTPGLIAAGVLFGLVRWRTGRIWPAVAAHAAFNCLTLLLQYFWG